MNTSMIRIVAAEDGRPHGFVVGLATVLALLSASCCVLPIGLAIVGLGGAWVAMLASFVAYRAAILVAVGLVVLWAWVRLIGWPGRSGRYRGAVALAAIATLSFAIAASSPLWEADATRLLMEMWSVTQ